MIYKVTITETRQRIVAVEASSPNEAHRRVSDAWNNCEVTLGKTDFDGVEFYVTEARGSNEDQEIQIIERKD